MRVLYYMQVFKNIAKEDNQKDFIHPGSNEDAEKTFGPPSFYEEVLISEKI